MKKVKKVTFSISEETRELLQKAYAEAEKDSDRKKVIDEWRHLETEDWEVRLCLRLINALQKPLNGPGVGKIKMDISHRLMIDQKANLFD